ALMVGFGMICVVARIMDRPERRPAAGAVRGGYVSRQRPWRTEAQQDQLGGADSALAERNDRDCRRKPVAARQPRQGAQASATSAVSAITGTSWHRGDGVRFPARG